jgi:hypothetical protein
MNMFRNTNISTLIVDTEVHQLRNSKNKYIVKGVAKKFDTGIRYDEIASVKSKIVPKNRLAYAEQEVINKIEQQFTQLYGGPSANTTVLKDAFARLRNEVSNGGTIHCTWKSKSTNVNALKYFERNVLPLLTKFIEPDRIMLDSDRLEILEKLADKCIKSSGGKAQAPNEVAYNHLCDADIIYSRLCELEPRLPDLTLAPASFIAHTPLPEQIKSLPRPVLTSFCAALNTLVETEPYNVFFAIFCVFGCRPAEAAGLKPSSLNWSNEFCVAMINGQEQDGEVIYKLKNEYSRRKIIIPFWGFVLLKKCCDVIGEEYPKGSQAMNSASKCAQWVKQLLLECAENRILANNLDNLVTSIPDDDKDGSNVVHGELRQDDLQKIACYVLRRNFASIARNIMGLSLLETDCLLGHAPLGDNTRMLKSCIPDFNSPITQCRIAKKMERFIFDPNFSLNPACSPYHLSNESTPLIEFSEYVIENNSDFESTISLDLTAAEAGECIKITAPHNSTYNLNASSIPKLWQDISRTVIGKTDLSGLGGD